MLLLYTEPAFRLQNLPIQIETGFFFSSLNSHKSHQIRLRQSYIGEMVSNGILTDASLCEQLQTHRWVWTVPDVTWFNPRPIASPERSNPWNGSVMWTSVNRATSHLDTCPKQCGQSAIKIQIIKRKIIIISLRRNLIWIRVTWQSKRILNYLTPTSHFSRLQQVVFTASTCPKDCEQLLRDWLFRYISLTSNENISASQWIAVLLRVVKTSWVEAILTLSRNGSRCVLLNFLPVSSSLVWRLAICMASFCTKSSNHGITGAVLLDKTATTTKKQKPVWIKVPVKGTALLFLLLACRDVYWIYLSSAESIHASRG